MGLKSSRAVGSFLLLLAAITSASASKCSRLIDGTTKPRSNADGKYHIFITLFNRTDEVFSYMPNARYTDLVTRRTYNSVDHCSHVTRSIEFSPAVHFVDVHCLRCQSQLTRIGFDHVRSTSLLSRVGYCMQSSKTKPTKSTEMIHGHERAQAQPVGELMRYVNRLATSQVSNSAWMQFNECNECRAEELCEIHDKQWTLPFE